MLIAMDCLSVILLGQGRSQEFAKGDRGDLGTKVQKSPSGVQGQSRDVVWSKAPRSRRHMLNIRLNIAIDHHKSRTVQSQIIL